MINILAGLNQEDDQIRAQILNRDPFPTRMQSYAVVQGEESRKNVMVHVPFQERKAMVCLPVTNAH